MKIRILETEPVLLSSDLEKSIQYYTTTLGFHLNWSMDNQETGKIEHASISLGKSRENLTLQLSQANSPFTPSGWLYVRIQEGIKELFRKYKANGVKISSELEEKPWRMVEFHCMDLDGNQLRFAFNPYEA